MLRDLRRAATRPSLFLILTVFPPGGSEDHTDLLSISAKFFSCSSMIRSRSSSDIATWLTIRSLARNTNFQFVCAASCPHPWPPTCRSVSYQPMFYRVVWRATPVEFTEFLWPRAKSRHINHRFLEGIITVFPRIPRRLFLFLQSRGALNRGRALIQGERERERGGGGGGDFFSNIAHVGGAYSRKYGTPAEENASLFLTAF